MQYGAATCGVDGGGWLNYIYQETNFYTYVFVNPTVDTLGCEVISSTVIEVNTNGSPFPQATGCYDSGS